MLDCVPPCHEFSGNRFLGLDKHPTLDWIEEDAAKYHSSIAILLRCLSDDKSSSIYSEEISKFMGEHSEHLRDAVTMAPFPEDRGGDRYYRTINGKLEDRTLLGCYAVTRSYRDIADPILDFVLAEHKKFLDGEYKAPFPIIVCGNPACNKLAMPERIGKRKFCSDDCKSADQRRNIPQKERTDYQWAYRLSKKQPAPKRKALNQKENRDRFKRVKAEKDYGPACQKLIRKLEQFT